MELLTAAQMRAIEQRAIQSGEVTGLELMERAGAGVVGAITAWRPELAEGAHSAVALCGPGNNGGDGFVVARLLQERGWRVAVHLYGDEAKLPEDAAENARRWRAMGEIKPWSDEILRGEPPDIYLDALFGGGLNRALPDEIYRITTELYTSARSYERMVAVDAPSGLRLDSGRTLSNDWDAVFAFLTVTFQRPRIGHVIDEGPRYCGELAVVDIGLDVPGDGALVTAAAPYAFDLDKITGHKFAHGHALILSGPAHRTGAARLAARGALRIGAGLVTVASPSDALAENAAHLTAIMLRTLDSMADFAEMLSDERITALCLGPGLGAGHKAELLVKQALEARRPTVLDADALTAFRHDPASLFAILHEYCVLTPHEGEFGRLFPDILEKLKAPASRGPAYSKVDATREAAVRAGCVVLFKGPDTVIAAPGGRCAVNSAHYERAAPWLATAGSGDVLAGVITGLMARSLDAMDAAETAAWLHVECGRALGPGLIAEDIPEALPGVLKRITGWKPPQENAP